MSHCAIVCTNGSGVIEIINPAVTDTLGYTPEQMLGQNISSFFASCDIPIQSNNDKKETTNNENNENNNEMLNNSDSEKIKRQLEMMKNGQSALVFVDHFICLTDDDQEMPWHGVTILGMTGDHNDVESYVFILRDETQLMEQQKVAEQAKARSENLLFQILPRDIVSRLNRGDKDISFTVQSVIFTDMHLHFHLKKSWEVCRHFLLLLIHLLKSTI